MNIVPAKVAGVKRVAMVVPTPDGVLNPLVILAANIAGADEVWRIGGAQALLGSMLSIKPLLELKDGVVSEAGRQRALPIERQVAYYLVAQGQFHRTLGLLDGTEALRQCR